MGNQNSFSDYTASTRKQVFFTSESFTSCLSAKMWQLSPYISWPVRTACFFHFMVENVRDFSATRGESMLPTIQPVFDWVHTNRKYKYGRGIDLGDCIVASKPSDPEHLICKRITGMPGDCILVDPSSSSELTNSHSECIKHDGFNKYIKVPEGHVWVTGDNLSHSLDSRSYSVLPMALIRGKIVGVNSSDKGLFSDEGKLWFWNFRRDVNTYVEE